MYIIAGSDLIFQYWQNTVHKGERDETCQMVIKNYIIVISYALLKYGVFK